MDVFSSRAHLLCEAVAATLQATYQKPVYGGCADSESLGLSPALSSLSVVDYGLSLATYNKA